jgi:hypothetical protein
VSWVNDLATVLGIPAGAATLAVAMYKACAVAEKAASKQALAYIACILKDTTWERSVRPSAIIEQVFNWTFGGRHLSFSCGIRSATATVVISVATLGAISAAIPPVFEWLWNYANELPSSFLATFLICGMLPDYIALGKTRLLIKFMLRRPRGILTSVALIPIDIGLSVAISVSLAAILFLIFLKIGPFAVGNEGANERDVSNNTVLLFSGGEFMALALFSSTLFTSVWTTLIILSTTVLKLLAPVHRFTAWFFDVEKHPVQAIGIVAGALVMIGSLIWTALRAI